MNDSPDYHHVQYAMWLIGFVVLIALGLIHAAGAAMLIPFVIIGPIVAEFSVLTTSVRDDTIRWFFGLGFPGGSMSVFDCERAEIVRTSLLEGWGIHLTPWHGWLWNASGFQAVELFRKGRTSVTLGTNDPQGLLVAIDGARQGT